MLSLVATAVLLAHAFAAPAPIIYNAAVVQTYSRGSPTASAQSNLHATLSVYETHTRDAAKQGAQIIVFPEAVLWNMAFGSQNPRATMHQYAETMPPLGVVPCTDAALANATQIYTASCMAREHRILVVMNMVSIVPCSSATDKRCPADNVYLFNTDVTFNETGALLAVYHKSHIFGTSPVLNEPATPDIVTFKSSFGVLFGLFICYDIEFAVPAEKLVALGVRDIPYSTSWVNDAPAMTAQMVQQGWSRYYQSNLLAANAGGGPMIAGGGIFSNGHVVAEYFNVTAMNVDKLLVGRVRSPPEEPMTASALDDDVVVPTLANVTNTTCATALIPNEGSPCLLISGASDAAYELQVSSGMLECHINVTFRSAGAAAGLNAQYAVTASNFVYLAPGTLDPVHVRTCSIFQCPQPVPESGPVVCIPPLQAGIGAEVTRLEIQSNVNTAWPVFAVNEEQVIDGRFIAFAKVANGTVMSLRERLPPTTNLYSASLYATY